MLSINMDDVMNVISSIQSYLIAAAVLLVAFIIVMILAGKIAKPARGKVRGAAAIAILAGLCVIVNMICTGPMSTMLDLISGSGTITDETSAEAQDLAVSIGEEGIVLLNNDDNLLPLASGDKLNVFGWASINPILGGAGSGALNDAYPTTDILTSLADAVPDIVVYLDLYLTIENAKLFLYSSILSFTFSGLYLISTSKLYSIIKL